MTIKITTHGLLRFAFNLVFFTAGTLFILNLYRDGFTVAWDKAGRDMTLFGAISYLLDRTAKLED